MSEQISHPVMMALDNTKDLPGWISAADGAAARGDYRLAADLLLECSKHFPEVPEVYELQAILLTQLQIYDQAQQSLMKAIHYKPQDAQLYNQLGTILYLNGDLPASRGAYLSALKLDNNFPDAAENLANVEAQLGILQPVQSPKPFVQALRALPEGNYRVWKERNRVISVLKLLVDPALQNMPQWVNFQNSCICNLRCPHCQTHGTLEERQKYNSRTYDMSDDLFIKAARECLPWVKTYALTLNGEPLSTPHLEDVLENFGKFDVQLDITTNGTLLTKEKLIKILPGLSRICISMDGATEMTFEALRLGANFKKLLRNIRLLTRINELMGTNRFDISMAMTVMGSNIKDMPHMIRLANGLGVKTVLGYQVIVFPGNRTEKEDVRLYKPLYNAYYARARKIAQELGVRMEFPLPFDDVQPDPDMAVDRTDMLIPQLPEDLYDHLPLVESLLDFDEIETTARELVRTVGEKNSLAQSQDYHGSSFDLSTADYLGELFYTYKDDLEQLSKNKNATIKYCDFLHRRSYVGSDGNVTPCCVPGVPVMGNLNDSSMREIWNGMEYDHFRRQFFSDDPHPSCKDCGFKQNVSAQVYLNELAKIQNAMSNRILTPGASPTTKGNKAGDDPEIALMNNLLKHASSKSGVREIFGDVTDEYWYWLNSVGLAKSSALSKILPRLPDDAIQLRFTGASGETTLSHGFNIYRTIKRLANKHLQQPMNTVLDFGCGWGRVVRFFLKDIDPENLYGIDATQEVLDICKQTIPGNFSVVDPFPPTQLPENAFDVIYAYSVFSHLAEEIHWKWLLEFKRLLKPGGLLILTTRARDFILLCEHFRRENHKDEFWKSGPMRSFLDTEKTLAEYERGDYVYEAAGGGGVLVPSIFGETCISKKYVENRWTEHFKLEEYVDDRSVDIQNFIVVSKHLAS